MEIKDINNVQKLLKVEIDEMGRSVNKEELARERFFPILKQEFDLIFLKSTQNSTFFKSSLLAIDTSNVQVLKTFPSTRFR